MAEIKNAIIKRARITMGERALLTAYLDLDYGGAGQSFGGHALYLSKTYKHHELLTSAGHFFYRVMEVAGVEDWDALVGKTIRVRGGMSHIEAIGHIVKDDWFVPSVELRRDDADTTTEQAA